MSAFQEITSHSGMTHLASPSPSFTIDKNRELVAGRTQAICGFHIKESAPADGRRCPLCESVAEGKK